MKKIHTLWILLAAATIILFTGVYVEITKGSAGSYEVTLLSTPLKQGTSQCLVEFVDKKTNIPVHAAQRSGRCNFYKDGQSGILRYSTGGITGATTYTFWFVH